MRVAFGIVLALLLAACGDATDPFDRAGWQAGAGDHAGRNPRAGFVQATREAGVTVGTSRTTIRALLGPPDSSGPDADIWYLGRDDLSADFRSLRLDYDAAGTITAITERR